MTVYEIAALAGISIGTVDRVLHKRGRVSAATRAKVEAIIEQYQFTPNPVARRLKKNRPYRFCALIPKRDQDAGYWGQIIAGIERAAGEKEKKRNIWLTGQKCYFIVNHACILTNDSINFLENLIMKTAIYNFLPVLIILVTVVCICIFTVYKKKKETPKENYTAPSGFDRKKAEGIYGTLTEKSYSSTTTGATRKCYVYTPPGYDPNITYPVMYLLHGIGGTHTEWLGGSPNEILSNLINAGKAKPMIVVLPNARAMNPDNVPSNVYGTENVNAFNNFINDLKNDLMPFIENNYPVSNERNKRAIAGLSIGGMESLNIGITMPETFGFIGSFSASPSLPLLPGQMKLPDEYKNNTFIMICCGLEDGLLSFSQNYNKSLEDNGVKTTYYTIPGSHGFDVWKNGLYNFTKRIF